MAERGLIYWGISNETGITEATALYICSGPMPGIAENAWRQTASSTTPPWNNNTTFTEVIFNTDADLVVYNCIGWFKNKTKITRVRDIGEQHISGCTSCKEMFYGCTSLESVEYLNFNLNDVVCDMSYMFYGCNKLKGLYNSFYNPYGDKTNMNRVTNASYMFYNCSSFGFTRPYRDPETLIYYGWNGFYHDNSNTPQLINTSYMFYGCAKLAEDGIYNPETGEKIEENNIIPETFNIDVRNVTNTSHMFENCTNLQGSDGALWELNTENVIDMSYMFNNCKALHAMYIQPDGAKFSFKNAKNVSHMFAGTCTINTINFSDSTILYSLLIYDLNSIEDFSYMFSGSTGLMDIPFSTTNDALSFKNAKNMSYMFDGCSNIRSAKIVDWYTPNVTNMSYMFRGCTLMLFADIANFIIDNLVNTSYMFDGCTTLQKIFTKSSADWNKSSKLSSSSNMFRNCTSLVGGNGTRYSSSNVNKAYARIDKDGQVGYFSVSERKVVIGSLDGEGTITGVGTYEYGDFVKIKVTPDNDYYKNYVDIMRMQDDKHIIYDDVDSIGISSYTIELINSEYEWVWDEEYPDDPTKNHIAPASSYVVDAEFLFRETYNLSVVQPTTNYQIFGEGSYKYLDAPVLIVDMNEAALSFDGWYRVNDLVSTSNPYSFTMPDSDLTLIAKFTESPFDDVEYRQFILTNGNGEKFKLAAKGEKPFLEITDGLGFSKKLTTITIGYSEEVQYEKVEMPKPKGTLYFYNDTNSNIYKKYNEFIRFATVKPLTLWYKTPISQDESINSTYHIPVEITDIGKVDIDDKTNALICPISFYGLGFWKETQINVEKTSTDISIFNNGDFECGVKLTLTKEDSTAFENPTILFKNGTKVYGKCKIGGTYDKVVLNTVNKEESIELYNGNSVIEDAFNFIDFSAADGLSQFPFPKLQNGVITTIEFSYDNSQESENKSYVAVYDKEYVSV